MHVELAPRRREAVHASHRRPGIGHDAHEQRPGRGGGVKKVQVVEIA